jgi:beta-mannosidase
MVWQEIMLACALYPIDEDFLAEITMEVQEQSLRLATHASIVVFGGNNENEVALQWFDASLNNRDLYVSDYSTLYGQTIYPALTRMLGTSAWKHQLVWVDSSPSNGLISKHPYAKLWTAASTGIAGDMHFYDYSCDCEDVASYPDARFVSEFGFQSMPSYLSYEPVTEANDRHPNSPLLLYRQRHQHGNQQIDEQLARHYKLPAASCDDEEDLGFDNYLYLTAIQQSACYETAIQHWRSRRDVSQMMGILYWQLNDIWQGPSWASMEWAGRWKPLLYTIRRVYASLSLYIEVDAATGSIRVYAINDAMDDSIAASLAVELIPWNPTQSQINDEVVVVNDMQVTIPSASSALLWHGELNAATMQACSSTSCYVKAIASSAADSTSRRHLEAWKALAPMKEVDLVASPVINVDNFHSLASNIIAFEVTVSAASPSLFFELMDEEEQDVAKSKDQLTGVIGSAAGWFSDNNFLAEAGRSYSIEYHAVDLELVLTVESFRSRLKTRVLQSVYNCQVHRT